MAAPTVPSSTRSARLRRYGVAARTRRPERGGSAARSGSASSIDGRPRSPWAGATTSMSPAHRTFSTASTGRIALAPKSADTRSARRPPARPPSVPIPATCPKRCFAVCGSNRSVAISQNPDPSIGPRPDTWRYTSGAATRGETSARAHSATSSTALTMNMAGTNRSGVTCRSVFELKPTSATEKTEVSMTIRGSEVTSRFPRYSASRAVLPAMNCAATIAAHSPAAPTAEIRQGGEGFMT